MKHKLRVVGLASLALALFAGPVFAQAPVTLGMVDVEKAFSSYKATKASNEEVNALVNTFKRELDIRSTHRLLGDAELTELIKLRSKSPLTDADRKRIDELEVSSKKLDEELNTLSQKGDATEADRARLKQLRETSNKNEASARTLADDYNIQVEKRKAELSDQITEAIRVAIETVAKAKGIASVVDKIAVLYGGIDLTDDVVKELNK